MEDSRNQRTLYLRNQHNHPVGCVAMSIQWEKKEVSYQLSVLNPLDRFNRKLARSIAFSRLTNKPYLISIKEDSFNVHDIFRAVLSEISKTSHSKFPTRAVKAAKKWLLNNLDK